MDRLIEAKGWATDINVRTLLARWSSLVGGVNAAHSHPESYADTVLTVPGRIDRLGHVDALHRPQLVARLNDQLGRAPSPRSGARSEGPSWKKGRRSVRDERARDTYG